MLTIFQGKKAKLSKLIMKSLQPGPRTPRQIAEYVYMNKGINRPGKTNQREIKSLVSEITRKTEKQKGRLYELNYYHYIERDGDCWELTPKGLAVSLTLYDDLTELLPRVGSELAKYPAIAEKMYELPLMKTTQQIFKRHFKQPMIQQINTMKNLTKSPMFMLQLARDFTREIINQGMDLDNMTNENFSELLNFKYAYFSFNSLFGEQFKRMTRGMSTPR